MTETFVLGWFQSNCYVLADDHFRKAWIIDPGGPQEQVLAYLQQRGLSLRAILLTHGHLDHVMGVAELRRVWPEVPIHLHPDDLPLYRAVVEQGKAFNLDLDTPPEPVKPLADGQLFTGGKFEIKVLATPGHTPGGCSFLVSGTPETPLLFSGDTLFRESVGRTDLPGGDFSLLEKSLHRLLYQLDPKVVVLPGHGAETTIGHERKHNPHVPA